MAKQCIIMTIINLIKLLGINLVYILYSIIIIRGFGRTLLRTCTGMA